MVGAYVGVHWSLIRFPLNFSLLATQIREEFLENSGLHLAHDERHFYCWDHLARAGNTRLKLDTGCRATNHVSNK